MIIQKSMRLKVLILPFALALSVLIAILFIKPAFSDMMSARDALASKEKQLENLKSQTQKLQAMKTKWEAMAEEQNLVVTAFPDTESLDSYVSEITSKASRSGVLLTDIESDQKTGSGTEQTPAYVCSADSSGTLASAGAAVPQPAGASATGTSDASGLQNLPGSSGSCFKAVGLSLSAKGSWEQMLDFFRYLEDMNRISNVKTVTLATETQPQSQTPSDTLTVDISVSAFFKEKARSGSMAFTGNLAGQDSFDQKSLEKLKETIYAPYDVPVVSPSGERNIFK